MKHFRDLMIGADGKLLEYGSFRKVVSDQGYIFNNNYLKAEYHVAKYSAVMANKWENLTSEYLEYSTVGDRRVRPEHARLDKFTAFKSDPVWNKIYPIKAWGCRCTVVPGKAQNAEKTMTSIEAAQMMKPLIKDTIFDNHVGKSRTVFTDKHPFFKFNNKRATWRQYGLKSEAYIKEGNLPTFEPKTREQYFEWWRNQPKSHSTGIIVKDVLNREILLDEYTKGMMGTANRYFRDHVLIGPKSSEKRHEFAWLAPDILENPDEIWLQEKQTNYIKYFEGATIKLVIVDGKRAKTMFRFYEVDSGELSDARSGLLMYRK